jgi:hypothetical protein
VNLSHTRYGWFCGNKKGTWKLPVLALTLWDKWSLKEVVNNTVASNYQELADAFETFLLECNLLGLIEDEPSVMVL